MRLLLDAHLPPALAQQLRRHDVDAVATRDWLDGSYRSASDDVLLAAAYSDERILVTYDCRTIPPLLKEWAETGQHHGGVILVDAKSIRPSDAGGLLHALLRLVETSAGKQWEDRVVFLRARS